MERAARWADGGTPYTREDDVRLFAMLQQAGQLAARAVEIIFAAAGSSAAKRGTRLQRYYRDVAMYHGHIAAQHLATAVSWPACTSACQTACSRKGNPHGAPHVAAVPRRVAH